MFIELLCALELLYCLRNSREDGIFPVTEKLSNIEISVIINVLCSI